MTDREDLRQLKKLAKSYARVRRIAHHEALDIIARQLDQPHWRALSVAWDKGWRLSSEQWIAVTHFSGAGLNSAVRPANVIDGPEKLKGTIDGHEYTLQSDLEVAMYGRGWCIVFEHSLSEQPKIERYDDLPDNPILDSSFREQALRIGEAAADQMRGEIAADWPRRSTKPDAKGRARHPLRKELSSTWYCLHCDAQSSATQMAANMWHCPKCSATPIDIFSEPFWAAPWPPGPSDDA